MKRMIKIACGTLVSLFLSICPALAQGNSQGHGHGNPHNQSNGGAEVTVLFGAHDRQIIRDYYQNQYSNLPPGLAKRGGNLPPGLQKHLERDGTLPPGLQKRVSSFPVELEGRLPRLPSTYRRVILGQIAIILDRRTQRIVDIIHDVLHPES